MLLVSNVMSVLLSVQSLSKVHIFNWEVPHEQASLHCDSIGGHFPLPTSSQVKLKTKTNLKCREKGFQPFLDGVTPNSQTINYPMLLINGIFFKNTSLIT
jgi:hypothetical protein